MTSSPEFADNDLFLKAVDMMRDKRLYVETLYNAFIVNNRDGVCTLCNQYRTTHVMHASVYTFDDMHSDEMETRIIRSSLKCFIAFCDETLDLVKDVERKVCFLNQCIILTQPENYGLMLTRSQPVSKDERKIFRTMHKLMGIRLKNAREALKWSVKYVAYLLDIPVQDVRYAETASMYAKYSVIRRLEQLYAVHVTGYIKDDNGNLLGFADLNGADFAASHDLQAMLQQTKERQA